MGIQTCLMYLQISPRVVFSTRACGEAIGKKERKEQQVWHTFTTRAARMSCDATNLAVMIGVEITRVALMISLILQDKWKSQYNTPAMESVRSE
jgi:hypothetical protein